MHCNAAVFLASALLLFGSSAFGQEQTCKQLLGGAQANEADKGKVQLCELVRAADSLDNVAAYMRLALTEILNQQGVTVEESVDATSGDMEKRKNEYLRFGKRKHEYLRFGKRKNEYLRFGRK